MSLVTASNWSHLKTEGPASRWGYWTHPDKLLAEPGPVLSWVETLNRRMKWLQGVVSHRCVIFHLKNKLPLSLSLCTIHTAPASLSIGFLLSVSSDMSLSFLAPVAGLPIKRSWYEKQTIFFKNLRSPANGLHAVSWTTSLFPPDGRIDAEVIICLHDQKAAFYLWHLDRIVSILE